MSRKPKEKIKPQWMRWFEDSFQADVRVRYMKPMQRHFYRALIIQSFYCDTRPFLPDNDDLLWMLADANDKDHWMEHREVVRGMFTPVVKDEIALLSHGKILRDWKNTEAMYSGKATEREAVKQGTHGQPKPTRGIPMVGDNRRQNGTEPGPRVPDPREAEGRRADATSPESRIAERSEAQSKPTIQQINASDSVSGSGLSSSESPSSGKNGSEKPVGGLGERLVAGAENRFGKSATGAGFEKPDEDFGSGDVALTLINRFWAIAKKKPEGGKYMGSSHSTADEVQWMTAMIKMYEENRVRFCLDHIARSDYWGTSASSKLDGIPGFHNAFKAIYKQADAYMAKVKETTAAKKAGRL